MNSSDNLRFMELKTRLERLDPPTTNVIIHDQRFTTEAGRSEIEATRAVLGDRPIETFDVPVEWLKKLYIFVSPDQFARYRNGFPIVIRGVDREDLAIRQKHDRHDGDLVKAAKQALEIETFRLTGRQAGIELARNTRLRTLTASEAEHRAKQTMGVAAHRSKVGAKLIMIVPTFDTIMRLVEGLIDRGRRLVKAFFAILAPKDLIVGEQAIVRAMMHERGAGILEHIEEDNIGRVRGTAWHRERAGLFTKAMESWAKRAAPEKPITVQSGKDLTNAVTERMTATALMKIAISGDLQPSNIHKNLLIEEDRFAIGRLIGQLSRGRPIEIDAPQAKILRHAIIKRGFGCLETQSDSMNFLLADAALSCRGMAAWMRTLDCIAATGVAETIQPQPR
ncbi:MAG: hypothetical protein AB1582_23330 [Pseudomonadota bacterium]